MSTDTIDLEITPVVRPTSPVPMVDRWIVEILGTTSNEALDAVKARMKGDYNLMAQVDKDFVVSVGNAQRAKFTSIVAPVSSSLPVVGETIGSIVANANEETIAARRRMRAQSAAQIQTAITASRSAMTALFRDGQAFALDPASGNLGVVIHYGKRIASVDPVTKRDRQALIRWADVESALSAIGEDLDLLGESCSCKRHLGEAVKVINNQGRIARAGERLDGTKAIWVIGSIDTDSTNTSMGQKDTVITLDKNNVVSCSNDSEESQIVLADYYRRVNEDRISATEFLRRVDMALASMGARDCDFGLYAAPGIAPRATRLLRAVEGIAGRRFYVMGVASDATEELAKALSQGFTDDLVKLENDVEAKISDMRKLSGATFIERLEGLRQAASGLGAILGASFTAAYTERLATLDAKICASLDATAQRFANLELS